MNWIVAALLMYLFSVLLYLLTRLAQKKKIPIQEYSLWSFGLPAIGFFVVMWLKGESINTTPVNWFWLIFSAIFFSWLGNYFSQKSMIHAANVGYPLIISKSYVVYSAIASIWLFSAPLSKQEVLAIALIVFFSALITLGGKNTINKNESMLWFYYAIGAFFCWGSLALASKYLLNNGVTVMLRLLIIHVIVAGILITEIKYKQIKLHWNRRVVPLLVLLGISAGFFNYFMQLGFSLTDNPGLINATNSASISAVAILSVVIFKDELNFRKIIGIIGVTAGLVMLMV